MGKHRLSYLDRLLVGRLPANSQLTVEQQTSNSFFFWWEAVLHLYPTFYKESDQVTARLLTIPRFTALASIPMYNKDAFHVCITNTSIKEK